MRLCLVCGRGVAPWREEEGNQQTVEVCSFRQEGQRQVLFCFIMGRFLSNVGLGISCQMTSPPPCTLRLEKFSPCSFFSSAFLSRASIRPTPRHQFDFAHQILRARPPTHPRHTTFQHIRSNAQNRNATEQFFDASMSQNKFHIYPQVSNISMSHSHINISV